MIRTPSSTAIKGSRGFPKHLFHRSCPCPGAEGWISPASQRSEDKDDCGYVTLFICQTGDLPTQPPKTLLGNYQTTSERGKCQFLSCAAWKITRETFKLQFCLLMPFSDEHELPRSEVAALQHAGFPRNSIPPTARGGRWVRGKGGSLPGIYHGLITLTKYHKFWISQHFGKSEQPGVKQGLRKQLLKEFFYQYTAKKN